MRLICALACVVSTASAAAHATAGRIFFLDVRGGRVLSANPDGSDLKVMLKERKNGVDGIAIDVEAGHIFWTNMGKVKLDDGSIQLSDAPGLGWELDEEYLEAHRVQR